MGLTFSSLIILDRLVIVKRFRLLPKIGECPDSIVEKIEEMLNQMERDRRSI